ncbi:Retrovirus-related Pol polyprotein from transposon 17.6 [Vitis vinifera]|uniref:Retrovirus-related Pol polyprotein from transposon 17.6 n=1 Tax=Vitis vinifera TaxID=29760 RepID=A0A438H037_VITVI|nr:Retrovirus-related Pol polyprotein from transposon 17.6 [Vitis vinifera]
MRGGDDHLAWKRPVSSEACRGLRTAGDPSIRIPSLHVGASEGFPCLCSRSFGSDFPLIGPFVPCLDIPLWIRAEEEYFQDQDFYSQSGLSRFDQFTTAMASIQEALASLRQEIGGQQGRPSTVQDETPYDSHPPPPPPPVPSVLQASPYVLHGHSEIAPPIVAQAVVADDTHARMDRIEQSSLPAKFRMPDIERCTGIGCPRLHLRLYSTVMRAHGLDEPQMITLFPLSLSGATQRWFASLESSRRRTWDDLAQEFLRQFSFNTVVDVSRRELEALRQRTEESVSSFISRWRGKIAEIVDRPSERDQIQMVFEEPTAEDRQTCGRDSSPSDVKGKKPFIGPRSTEVGAINSSSQRPLRRHQPIHSFSSLILPMHLISTGHGRLVQLTIRHTCHSHWFYLLMPLRALRDPRSPTQPQGSHATLLSSSRDLRRLIPTWSPADFCSVCFEDAEIVFTDRHAVEPGSSEAYGGWFIDCSHPSATTSADSSSVQDGFTLPRAYHASWDLRDEWGDSRAQMPAPFRLVPEATFVQAATSEPLTFTRYSVQAPYILIPDVEEVQAPNRGGQSRGWRDFEAVAEHSGSYFYLEPFSVLQYSSGCTNSSSEPDQSRRVPSVLLDNGSALNVCPLATAIALGYAPSDFGPSTQTVRAYDSTRREVMGTLEIELLIGPATFVAVFQVLRIPTSFNLLLGRPWIHRFGAIPSSLHQKVKFIHDGQVVVVQSVGDMFIAAEPVLEISHTDDDLFLIGSPSMSGARYYAEHVLSTRHGVGSTSAWTEQFIAIPDHDVPFGLGFIPTEADYLYMARLRKERVRARLTHTPFYYPLRLYTRSLADYFVRASEPHAPSDGIVGGLSTTQEAELQRLVQELRLRDGAPGTRAEVEDVVDGAAPHDEYIDEMLALSLSQIEETIQPGLASSFDLFGVFVIELAEESLTVPALESVEDLIVFDDLIDSHAGIIEGASDFVDPPLSFESVDQRVSPAVGDTEIVDFGTTDQPRELRIKSDLSTDERDSLIQLLRHIWTSLHGPMRTCRALIHLLSSIVCHFCPMPDRLSKLRRLHPRWSLQVKEEIQKQLSVGFLSVVEYPEWLANVVPVPKRTANQILMAPEDMEKTSFITEWGTYCYRVMPFGLKNAGATYQRAATTLFHDMMHRDVEVYVDDMIVKSRGRSDHLAALGECQRAFERIREYCCRLQVLAPPTPGRPLLLYYQSVALGCMLAQLDDSGKDRAIYYLIGRLMRWLVLLTEFDIHYVTQKSIRGSIVADHLASLPVSDARAIDDDFPDEDVAAVTSLSGWRMYFDGAANHSGYGIGVLLISPHGDHIPRSVRLAFSDRHPATNNIVEYEACILGLETALELGIRQMEVFGDSNLLLVARFEDLRYTHLPRAQNQFADALATLASMIDIPADATVRPLLIESRSAPAYCCLIDDMEIDDGLPWYHDIYHFLRLGVYPEAATAKDRRALRQVMREVHAGVCGPHMGGHMLARKIMRTGYFWLTMETDCCRVCSEMSRVSDTRRSHSLVIEFILVAIDYFTKWVKAASYARLTSSGVASFIRLHIICRYGVPHELISDRGVHFRAEVDTLVQRYGIRHHRSTAYRPQTNGAKLPFALWAYRTSFRTSTGATPYSLVYGMETMLPVEIEMGSLRVALEQQIPETDWAQAQILKGSSDPSRSGPYFIRELTPEGAAWLMDLDGNQFSESTNVDQLKRITCLMRDDLMSPIFPDLSHVRCHTGAYSVLEDLYGSSQSGPYREPSSQARALRCLDVVTLPSEGRFFDMWEPLLTRSARFILVDIVVILGWGYVECLDPTSSFQCGTHQVFYASPWCYSRVIRADRVHLMPYWGIFPSFSHGGDRSLTLVRRLRLVEPLLAISSSLRFAVACHTGAYFPLIVSLQSGVQSCRSFTVYGIQSHHVTFFSSAFRAISQFDVQSHHHYFSVSAFRAIISFQIDIQSRILESLSLLSLTFRVIIITSLSFGVQSHHRFSDRHSESPHRFWRSESLSLLSLTFRVIIITSQFRRSELSSVLRSTFRVASSISAFRVVITLSLTFRVIIITSQFRRSESLSLLSLTFRVIIITSQFRRSELSSIFRSIFRVTSSVSAFRVVITSQFDVQSHHHHFSVSAFRAIIGFQIDIQSRILKPLLSACLGLQSRYCHLVCASRAITIILFRLPEPLPSSCLGLQSRYCRLVYASKAITIILFRLAESLLSLVLPSVATLRDHMASLSWLLWNQTMLFEGANEWLTPGGIFREECVSVEVAGQLQQRGRVPWLLLRSMGEVSFREELQREKTKERERRRISGEQLERRGMILSGGRRREILGGDDYRQSEAEI